MTAKKRLSSMFHRKKKVRDLKVKRKDLIICLVFKFQTLYEQCNKGEGLDVSAFRNLTVGQPGKQK